VIVLAIDPGYTESAFVFFDDVAQRPVYIGIVPNAELLAIVRAGGVKELDIDADQIAVEKIAMGGMVAGQETFDTAMVVGRLVEAWESRWPSRPVTLIKRIEEKMCICGDSRAKDTNIRQALIDRFGPGRELAIGTKKNPGPLYGVKEDIWSALAVAITYLERRKA
jgi:hypothetical protein